MKHIIIGICSCVMAGLLILTVYTFYGRSVRKSELNQALTLSMEQALEQTDAGYIYGDGNKEELIAVFLENFLMQIDSSSEATVHVLDADYEKGLLSVEAVLSYRHPIGLPGTVAMQKTVLRENYGEEKPAEFCSISYIVEGSRYKIYNVLKGSTVMIPGAPVLSGKHFLGWRELEGREPISLAGRRVEQDCVFVAVFR